MAGKSYIEDAYKRYQALSGDNAYNRMMKAGTSGISRQQSISTNRMFDEFGTSNPGLLREVLDDINRSAAESAGQVGVNAAQFASDIDLEGARQMSRLGTVLAQLETDEQRRQDELLSSLVGGGLSLFGTMYGASQSKDAANMLRKILSQETGGNDLNIQLLQSLLAESRGGYGRGGL